MQYRLLAFAALLIAGTLQTSLPAAAQSAANPAPTATPTVEIPPALPPLVKYEHFISAGYLTPPIVRNEFSAGYPGARYRSTDLKAAVEFPLLGRTLTGMVKFDSRRFTYPHFGTAGPVIGCVPGSNNASCVTGIGPTGTGALAVPSFQARENDYDIRAGVRALEPRLYLGVSYLQRTNNYGYPRLKGYGLGFEKLPDVDQVFSLYGGIYYYPSLRGTFTVPGGPSAGTQLELAYHVVRYDVGLTIKPSATSPFFLEAGYLGDRSKNANNAPATISRSAPFLGLGVNF